jgi:hypothetical protein
VCIDGYLDVVISFKYVYIVFTLFCFISPSLSLAMIFS